MKKWIPLFISVLILVGGLSFLAPYVTNAPISHDQSYGNALIGGPFTLTSHTGETVTEKILDDHYSLVFFGFTHCPDICPTSLLIMANALDELSTEAREKLQIVFVSVDPQRDTPERLATYVGNFSDEVIGLTGSAEQIKHMTDTYKVYYSKVEQADSALGYLIDHSGFIFLMGPNGNYIEHYPHHISTQELTATLRSIVRP